MKYFHAYEPPPPGWADEHGYLMLFGHVLLAALAIGLGTFGGIGAAYYCGWLDAISPREIKKRGTVSVSKYTSFPRFCSGLFN